MNQTFHPALIALPLYFPELTGKLSDVESRIEKVYFLNETLLLIAGKYMKMCRAKIYFVLIIYTY